MQLFPNASQDGNKNMKDVTVNQDEIFQEEKFDPRYSYNESLDESPDARSWSKAITIYTDFVLAAFTDSYSTVRHVVCFLYRKTWITQLFRQNSISISNFFFVSLIGILL